jgi:hypothetical protein
MTEHEEVKLVDHAKPITEVWVGVFQREGLLSEVILTGILQMELGDGQIAETLCFTVEWHSSAIQPLIERCEQIIKDKLETDGEVWTYRLLHFENPTVITTSGAGSTEDMTWRAGHGGKVKPWD